MRAVGRVAETDDYFQGQAENVVECKEEDIGRYESLSTADVIRLRLPM